MDYVRAASADVAIEGAHGCAAATADRGARGQYQSGPNRIVTTALQHCAPGYQHALTPSRWRCRRCGFEQGDRHWIANAAAAALKSSTGDGSVQVTRPMPDTQTQVPVRARRPDSPRRSPF